MILTKHKHHKNKIIKQNKIKYFKPSLKKTNRKNILKTNRSKIIKFMYYIHKTIYIISYMILSQKN